MSRQEKKEARIERYEELAQKAEQASQDAYQMSNRAVENIPTWQPILIGHHSERKHRAALERSHNAMRRSIALDEKADYYREKAKAAENNDAIYAEDDDAVERLEEKITNLETLQRHMKDANKIFKSNKLTEDQKIAELSKLGIDEGRTRQMLAGDFLGRIGYADYQLQNNNAVIRNAKKRLEQVKELKETPVKEYRINGVRVVENSDENRFQIFFDSKPNEEVRNKLKRAGYRWSPTNGCWQCYLNNRWNVSQGKEIVEAGQCAGTI